MLVYIKILFVYPYIAPVLFDDAFTHACVAGFLTILHHTGENELAKVIQTNYSLQHEQSIDIVTIDLRLVKEWYVIARQNSSQFIIGNDDALGPFKNSEQQPKG